MITGGRSAGFSQAGAPATGTALLLGAGGVTMMVVAWYQAAGTFDVERQLDWASVGLGGFGLAVVSLLVWLTTYRRAVTSRAASISGMIGLPASRDAAAPLPATATKAGLLVAAAGMVRYHREDCQLVEGKTVTRATPREHAAAGRRPCGVCSP